MVNRQEIADMEKNLDNLKNQILSINMDIHDNPDIFPQLKEYRQKLSDIVKSSKSLSKLSILSKNEQKELDVMLRTFSAALQSVALNTFIKYKEQYVAGVHVAFAFMIKYPQLFIENSDENISIVLHIRDILRHFLAEIYASSSTPEVFADLCQNKSVLSHEQTLSLLTTLIDKVISTLIKEILDDISDRDDEQKKSFVQQVRTKYPNASKNLNYILLSKNKRNTIKQDFLTSSKKSLCLVMQEKFTELNDGDFHEIIHSLSVLFMYFGSNEDGIDKMFSKYVSLFLEEQFQQSDHKKTSKLEKKVSGIQQMISSELLDLQRSPTKLEELPPGLKDDIVLYLSKKKINGNYEKLVDVIEKILQKFLTKKKNIRKQWFITKISSYSWPCVDDDFFDLLAKYGVSCIDETKWLQEEFYEEENIPEYQWPSHAKHPLSGEKNQILDALHVVDTLECSDGESRNIYLMKKICWYTDIFEQLGYTFDNKEKFIESTAEYCYSNDRLEKDIRRVLYDIIVKNKYEQHKDGRDYYVFSMPRWWRIILYKKWVIGTIWPHDYYEKFLKNNL